MQLPDLPRPTREGHILTAFSLSDKVVEVTMFGGTSYKDKKLADTTILHFGEGREGSTCTVIHSYCHTLILSYTHTAIYSYCHTLILPYTHTAIHSYCHTLILSYTHTVIHSYCHILILPYTHTAIYSYCHTLILSYTHTVILRFCHSRQGGE